MKTQNKRKIVNDPVYGFINIPSDLIFDLIEHPWFQRLRRIKQLGLSHYVYPGANHTRFQHALGAMHLTKQAISVLREKGHEITPEEAEAVTIAILLHDIGHGPFSHALEQSIVTDVSHEELSLFFMEELNREFDGQLDLAIEVFQNQYQKKFLYQLVSGQLDMDRMDYLRRDSFFSGVSEGVIGSDRIIKMLNVANDELVIDAKGIYSVEKFLIARRLMYWQVYLHKTVLVAESMLLKALQRARLLAQQNKPLFASPSLQFFLYRNEGEINISNLERKSWLGLFADIDDADIVSALKAWTKHEDKVLAILSEKIVNRGLFRIELEKDQFTEEKISAFLNQTMLFFNLNKEEAAYLVFTDSISNFAYTLNDPQINILQKDGSLQEISTASDILNIQMLSKNVTKYFLIYPKEITR
ncbi:MAG: HD domain-containing protein [Bacteroidales bacterium]|nr:HD domain-containing protein [Bacteroidales bacterium]MCF8457153.1 HD domain-containing protein [Bacteroidales bacterium]